MSAFDFSALPTEIQVRIAHQCEGNDLVSLCRTARWINDRCSRVLYRHVDLKRDRCGVDPLDLDPNQQYLGMLDAFRREQNFVHTLLAHPEYGPCVRVLKGMLFRPDFHYCPKLKKTQVSEEELCRAMQSITQARSVDIGTSTDLAFLIGMPSTLNPSQLFHSASSVTLVGQINYSLAKTILNSVNPAVLTHLRLGMVQDRKIGGYTPGEEVEDGRLISHRAMTGLLTPLIGRCTALQTLKLQKIGMLRHGYGWHAASEEAIYAEWAAFIASVQGTVKQLTFEQAEKQKAGSKKTKASVFRAMDDRFDRLVLPTLVSGDWPRLTWLRLLGVRGSRSQGRTLGLAMRLRAVHSDNTWIILKGLAFHYVPDYRSSDPEDEFCAIED